MQLIYEEPWRELAACRDITDTTFFAARDNIGAVSAAKAICDSCPVSYECLVYAIDSNQPDGIWGGLTRRDRQRVKRQWAAEEQQAS